MAFKYFNTLALMSECSELVVIWVSRVELNCNLSLSYLYDEVAVAPPEAFAQYVTRNMG